MSKLDDMLPGMYAEMHAKGAFKGDSWRRHSVDLLNMLRHVDYREHAHDILDYGCGPTGGMSTWLGTERREGYIPRVVPYDPYVEKYAADPWKEPLTAFFSCDVFEHMPLSQIRILVRRLCKHTSITHAFIALSTRPANKTLPNGLNAHITVRSAEWWQGFFDATLGNHFRCTESLAYIAEGEAVYKFVREEASGVQAGDGIAVPGRDAIPPGVD